MQWCTYGPTVLTLHYVLAGRIINESEFLVPFKISSEQPSPNTLLWEHCHMGYIHWKEDDFI